MLNQLLLIPFINLILTPAYPAYEKKQDADYVDEWCTLNGGKQEVYLTPQLRPDCTTSTHVVEIDSVRSWKQNLTQALRYGRASEKRAKLVLVVEFKEDLKLYASASAEIRGLGYPVDLEKLENFTTVDESLRAIKGPIVKQSRSKRCHVKGVGSYSRTKHWKPYGTLDECLKDNGVLPGGISETTLREAERRALLIGQQVWLFPVDGGRR